ncbi:hypothetical protein, partial [Syntrophothermus sp.]|uniref:hypothetical protein n=1 Tax=Syntrophothermus sp. TaxID=2736299 RepID=UPI00257DDB70
NYPMGVDFSSPCIFALVWTEILWCVMQDIEVQRCEFCQELFVSKKSSRFCSKKCNEDYLSTEETVRSTLKGLHQDLSRMIKKLEVGEASMEEYMELWRNWESLKLQAKGKARQAKKIHPGLVFLHTAEGKQVAQAMKQALREKDEYAEGDAWNDYVGLLKKYGIPQPPREWVKAFLKTP